MKNFPSNSQIFPAFLSLECGTLKIYTFFFLLREEKKKIKRETRERNEITTFDDLVTNKTERIFTKNYGKKRLQRARSFVVGFGYITLAERKERGKLCEVGFLLRYIKKNIYVVQSRLCWCRSLRQVESGAHEHQTSAHVRLSSSTTKLCWWLMLRPNIYTRVRDWWRWWWWWFFGVFFGVYCMLINFVSIFSSFFK